MMHEQLIVFASHNPNKLGEIQPLLPQGIKLVSLTDIGWTAEIPEPHETLEENAVAKVEQVAGQTDLACFSEDSGLEVDALQGRPGVYSARYAGAHGYSEDNIRKVLTELGQEANRSARFRAVIAFRDKQGPLHLFHGKVEGHITHSPQGTGGFGYDPIFIPSGFDQTFGQLPVSIKKAISHRTMAMRAFLEFLRSYRES